MTTEVALDYAAEFHRDWTAPENTPIECPLIDVNRVLAEHYELGERLVFTKNMVWDMEVRKTYAPDVYLPGLVKPGSLHLWETGESDFVQVSEQRLWLDPARYGLLIQRAHLDHERRVVAILGTGHIVTPDGRYLWAGTEQPLYHVEHVVCGTDARPLVQWRIVHLTNEPDARLARYFAELNSQVWLREFFEIYIRRDLGIELTRKLSA